MESRKVQKVGYSTLTISLPSEWTKEIGLKQGDTVFCVKERDGSLKIIPSEMIKDNGPDANENVVINADMCREEGMLENAQRVGARLTERLLALQAEFPVIGDVRGLGLMIGAEFTALDGTPAADLAKAVVEGCLKRRLLLLTCGSWNNTVRWIPPLVVTMEQVEAALAAFSDALAEAVL